MLLTNKSFASCSDIIPLWISIESNSSLKTGSKLRLPIALEKGLAKKSPKRAPILLCPCKNLRLPPSSNQDKNHFDTLSNFIPLKKSLTLPIKSDYKEIVKAKSLIRGFSSPRFITGARAAPFLWAVFLCSGATGLRKECRYPVRRSANPLLPERLFSGGFSGLSLNPGDSQ